MVGARPLMLWCRGIALVAFSFVLGTGLTACATAELDETAAVAATPADLSAMREAKLQFREGNYGKAIDAYRIVVEKDASNAEAWLGLAASYDEIRRFDLADDCYKRVISLIGETPAVLNNIGYSLYLRGDLAGARKKLAAAHEAAPSNPYVINNIEILNEKLVSLGAEPLAL